MEDLIPLILKEYGVRMRNQDSDTHRGPSFIRPTGIKSFRSKKVGGWVRTAWTANPVQTTGT